VRGLASGNDAEVFTERAPEAEVERLAARIRDDASRLLDE
jgi:hypothetical protein